MATRRQFLSGAAVGVFAAGKLTSSDARGAIGGANIAPATRGSTSLLRVKSVRRCEETLLRLGGIGDNWHMSWAADDRQYVSLCDGFGWPGMPGYDQINSQFHSRLYAIHGSPPDVRFEYLPGYPPMIGFLKPDDRGWIYTPSQYYNFGTLALDGRLYQFLSARNHSPVRPENGSPWSGVAFVGAKLIYSPDNGRTWCNQDGSTPVVWEPRELYSRETLVFFEEPQYAFSLLSVLQMGRNYEYNRDGYIYVYSPNGITDGTMNELVMFRVPKTQLLERKAYEYFAGQHSDGSASWTKDIHARAVVHTFPRGWVNTGGTHPFAWQPSVVYNAPLGLYLMANWGNRAAPDGTWFGKPSYLGFWAAPDPWGPWTQIHEETAWMPGKDPAARAFAPQIAPKWIAADGKSFWLVWSDIQFQKRSAKSGNHTAAKVQRATPYYAFNAQRVDIVTA